MVPPRATAAPSATLVLIAVALMLAAAGAVAVASRLIEPNPVPELRQNGEIVAVNGALIALDPITGETVPFPVCAACRSPSWSADGSLLAYLKYVAGEPGTVVFVRVRDMASGIEREIGACGGTDYCGGIALSPDGSRVAAADGDQLVVLGVEDGSVRQSGLRNVRDVAWSPDGENLLLMGGGTLFRVTSEGEDPQLLAQWPTPPLDPPVVAPTIYAAWSPDGAQIAYVIDFRDVSDPTDIQLDYQLWLMNADGSDRRQIWDQPGCCARLWGGPTWSPDGTQIAVVIARSLWIVAADGSDATELGAISAERIAWRPVD